MHSHKNGGAPIMINNNLESLKEMHMTSKYFQAHKVVLAGVSPYFQVAVEAINQSKPSFVLVSLLTNQRSGMLSFMDVIQAMFTSGYKESQWRSDNKTPGHEKVQEIFLPGVGAEALNLLLGFIYTGKLELSPLNIQSVLACASQLQVI